MKSEIAVPPFVFFALKSDRLPNLAGLHQDLFCSRLALSKR